jgi:hypothetical protein
MCRLVGIANKRPFGNGLITSVPLFGLILSSSGWRKVFALVTHSGMPLRLPSATQDLIRPMKSHTSPCLG